MNMKIRYPLKSHVAHNIFIYIITIVFIPFIVFLSFSFKNKPKAKEKFSIFVEAEVDKKKLKSHLEELLPEDLVINVYTVTRDERSFSSLYSAYSSNSDLIIVTESFAKTFELTPYVRLEETIYHSENNLSLYEREYGLPIKNNNIDYYSDYITYGDDNYYLFMRETSVHTLDIIDKGQTNQIHRVLEDIYHV